MYIWSRGDYTQKQKVASAKQPSSSERECGLKYLELGGDNVLNTKDIETAIETRKRQQFNNLNCCTQKSVDPGFGSSAIGVDITELVD